MLRTFVLISVLAAAAGGAARAQSLEEIDRREAAVVEAWQKTPLTFRHAVFVSGRPKGFGQFVERKSNVFKPGEKLVAYVEPVGYGWKDIGDGHVEFGFDVENQENERDEHIKFVTLSNCGLKNIPVSARLFSLINLTLLNLTDNQLARIPPSIGNYLLF